MSDKTGARPKTLVIHIGDHKTGTTTIQNALAVGSIQLHDAKLLYPAKMNHNYLTGFITSYRKGTPLPKHLEDRDGLTEVAAQIAASDADYAVLSAEAFENIPAPEFHDLVETFFRGCADRIHIVAYVRPHAQRILSSYAEQIKIGWYRGSMQEFFDHNLQNGRFHYAPRFAQWRELFGDEFTLRPMIRKELKNGSVLDDFAEVAFDGRPCTVEEFEPENQAMTVRELALMYFLQGQFQEQDPWLRHTLGWELSRQLDRSRGDSEAKVRKLVMARDLAEAATAAYRCDAEVMDATFFEGRPLMQTALRDMEKQSAPCAPSLDPSQFFSPEHLRNLTVMAKIIEGMLERQGKWPSYFHSHRIKDIERHKNARLGLDENGDPLEPEADAEMPAGSETAASPATQGAAPTSDTPAQTPPPPPARVLADAAAGAAPQKDQP
ncbi:hypothetical protein [Phaeobacter inhibens]|uniref:hypothetical protein n=1 Tax=Phaeobacter inhibens TaxID=221822 RepID=UPI0020C7E53B|nr:hypothetical protein [Phaeobacter inhibens]